ncbi:alkaline phosphatase family protein [Marinigracilibium pacificum]|uniref:Alkaline phosphatase family protein n=1 Tax=Marinigracilibium pacificum TaxID=2729599 RepID=A0A848J1A5_9BACT|nr:ectonucleotide pyrophosphatase/phosphodiesterase [Marinigracilibium pacificum]NMM49596.1 alkaline phosphatase family protein [Marinigracilibium pacificum]
MRLIFLLLLIPGGIFAQLDTVTILISYDGFRHDYVEKFDMKNFKDFLSEGVAADGLIPSFPSKTFANHYSIVTGLEPGHHGLPANSFYNRELKKIYVIRDREAVQDGRFYHGLPIWCYAQQNGLKTASYFWVGTEASINGCKPDYVVPYNAKISNRSRIDGMIEWLNLPKEERPSLILGYFSTFDDLGHKFGPNSNEVKEAAKIIDDELGYFLSEIKKSEVPVNLILVSDHGMEDMAGYEPIFLDNDNRALRSKYLMFNAGPFVYVYFRNKNTEFLKAVEDFKKVLGNSVNYNSPERFKSFSGVKQPWTPDLILSAPKGKIILGEEHREKHESGIKEGGNHGFSPEMRSMHGIFYANGPSFKHGAKINSFQNIHIYSLLVNILSLKQYDFIDGNDFLLEKVLNQEQ